MDEPQQPIITRILKLNSIILGTDSPDCNDKDLQLFLGRESLLDALLVLFEGTYYIHDLNTYNYNIFSVRNNDPKMFR
jgi:hypothetical protein